MPEMKIVSFKQLGLPIDIFISSCHCSKGEFFSIYNKQGR